MVTPLLLGLTTVTRDMGYYDLLDLGNVAGGQQNMVADTVYSYKIDNMRGGIFKGNAEKATAIDIT